MVQIAPHNLGGRNLGCSILDGAERLENGYIAGAPVRVDKLATYKI